MKDRVKNLEVDLERAIREKTDAQYEIKRLETQVQTMEKQMQAIKMDQMKAQGDSQSSGATVNRL